MANNSYTPPAWIPDLLWNLPDGLGGFMGAVIGLFGVAITIRAGFKSLKLQREHLEEVEAERRAQDLRRTVTILIGRLKYIRATTDNHIKPWGDKENIDKVTEIAERHKKNKAENRTTWQFCPHFGPHTLPLDYPELGALDSEILSDIVRVQSLVIEAAESNKQEFLAALLVNKKDVAVQTMVMILFYIDRCMPALMAVAGIQSDAKTGTAGQRDTGEAIEDGA